MEDKKDNNHYMNPYLAGVFLGLVLLASFLILGAGLGASGGIARVGAFTEGCILPSHTAESQYFGQWGENPLRYYLVFMIIGIVVGGFLSAFMANRVSMKLEKGNACIAKKRVIFALVGGILSGFASRMAQGCTSGQALSGGALLLTGSLVFLVFVFAGGYAVAYFVRSQWHD